MGHKHVSTGALGFVHAPLTMISDTAGIGSNEDRSRITFIFIFPNRI